MINYIYILVLSWVRVTGCDYIFCLERIFKSVRSHIYSYEVNYSDYEICTISNRHLKNTRIPNSSTTFLPVNCIVSSICDNTIPGHGREVRLVLHCNRAESSDSSAFSPSFVAVYLSNGGWKQCHYFPIRLLSILTDNCEALHDLLTSVQLNTVSGVCKGGFKLNGLIWKGCSGIFVTLSK